MSNSIKQIMNLIIGFVDKTLLPLLDNKLMQASKAVQQWNQLKSFLYQSDQIQIWKVEKFLVDMPLKPVNSQLRKMPTQMLDKQNYNVKSGSYYEGDQWKYRINQNIMPYQPQRKQNYINTSLPNQHIKQQKLQSKQSQQSFENLLSSFRKLCTNFQNNHKKLIMDRQSFAH